MSSHDRLSQAKRPGVAMLNPCPEPVEVLSGPLLCRLRIWNDSEWAALPPDDRPAECERVAGLGWVGAVPVRVLN